MFNTRRRDIGICRVFFGLAAVVMTIMVSLTTTVYSQSNISGNSVTFPTAEETVFASRVPPSYYPNFQMNDARESIQDSFVEISAAKNIGVPLTSLFFQDLITDFDQAFPFLPNESIFKITYEQCRLLTRQLSQEYSRDVFSQFIQGCHKPLERDMNKMRNTYTIVPKIKANPSSGALPLTVTFDAAGSVDPSIATIPSANFFWYFKDVYGIDQIIGQGPVVTYTFTEPGDHVVYLTVRSANQKTEGILDGSTTTTVSVDPEAANISLFSNGRYMDQSNTTKVGTVEAQQGITFDASGTIPKGGRTLVEHRWLVKSNKRTLFSATNEGPPGTAFVEFPQEGQFTVSLSVTDNQGNTIEKTYPFAISDPLAIVKVSPEEGNTSTTFRLDGSSSYSLVSRINQYTRDIINPDGEKIDTIQSKSISRQFDDAGPYKIQLTVQDEQGRKNTESFTLLINSTTPVAQFSMKPSDEWELPSQYRLDASLSSDVDVLGSDDILNYQWRFSPEEYVTVNEVLDEGRKILVSFEEVGDFDIKLSVNDNYGQLSEIEKSLSIESTLRPQLFVNPTATFWGAAVRFLSKSNKEVVFYEWDLGDGNTRELSSPAMIHSYDSVGSYDISLKVHTKDNEYNTISKKVFIGEKDLPIIAYEVKNNSNQILKQEHLCTVEGEEIPAYQVARRHSFSLDVSNSVNTKGEKGGLTVFFQPQKDDISKQKNFNYKFLDVGCQYIDIKVEDTSAGNITTNRVWFSVVNDLPSLKNLTLQFPQYGNSVGIGFGSTPESSEDTTFEATDFSNLIVKVVTQGAQDSDGAIAFFKRYYFNKDNPGRILETKITPANVPETYFTLQKIPGEYEFGVTLVDNDGGEVMSRQIIGHGPTVFFPPDSKNNDIPITTLRQSAVTAKVGEEIQFEVATKILSSRSDFATERSIKYDFDSDGEFDLAPTKDTSVSYYYTKPGTYTPTVKVLYRGNPGSARGEPITIEAGLVPLLITESAGTLVIGREVSIGEISDSSICIDDNICETSDQARIIRSARDGEDPIRSFIYQYPSVDDYDWSLLVTDEYGNTASKTGSISLATSGEIQQPFLSIPKAQHETSQSIITVGRQLSNAVVYYLPYDGGGACFLDTDITHDSDDDGDASNDRDLSCNTLENRQYSPLFDSVQARRHYDEGLDTLHRDILVNFLDKRVELDQKYIETYQDITNFIPLLDGSEPDIAYLKELLLQLRNNLDDDANRATNIVALYNYIEDISDSLSETERNRLDVIIFKLSDGGISATLGGNAFEQARQDILLLVPTGLKEPITNEFLSIENANGNRDTIKSSLQNILSLAEDNQGNGPDQIDPLDLDLIVVPKICQILSFFAINSSICDTISPTDTTILSGNNNGDPTTNPVPGNIQPTDDTEKPLFQKVLQWILYFVILLVVVLAGFFVFYLIKARLSSDETEEASDEET